MTTTMITRRSYVIMGTVNVSENESVKREGGQIETRAEIVNEVNFIHGRDHATANVVIPHYQMMSNHGQLRRKVMMITARKITYNRKLSGRMQGKRRGRAARIQFVRFVQIL